VKLTKEQKEKIKLKEKLKEEKKELIYVKIEYGYYIVQSKMNYERV